MKHVMKWLLSLLLALSANADVHRYTVTQTQQQILPIELPAEIVGSLPSATSSQRIGIQVRTVPQETDAAIYTFSGTGAVFSATLGKNDGYGASLQLSGSARKVGLDIATSYTLVISASTFRSGAQYAVRLGEFDPLAVTFDGNGGTPSTNEVTYLPGQPYGKFPDAVRDGYDFTGWATAATNGIMLATNTVVCVGYTNLFAQWTQMTPTNIPPTPNVLTNRIVFSANGGLGNMATQTFIYGEAQALSSNLFTRSHYVFDGWSTTATGAVRYADCAVVSNLSDSSVYVWLHAKWALASNAYEVAFDANGGEGTMYSQGFALGEAQGLSTNRFAWAGYRFIGWGTTSTGSVAYVDGQVVTNLANAVGMQVKLYAKWAKYDPYLVEFAANGGNGTMARQEFHIGQGQALSTNLFTRIGYQFLGWGVTNIGPVVYADAQVVTNLTTVSNGVVTLYAQWLLTPPAIHSNVVNGVTWFFSATNGTATILNVDDDGYCVAVRPQAFTILSVPGTFMVGTVTNKVTAIGECAFEGLTALTNVVIPVSVEEIAGNAFAACSNITTATLPMIEPLYSIMPDSYTRIRHVTVLGIEEFLEDEVSICEYAFSNCTSLVSASLPLGVTELPDSVFDGCTALSSFEMPYTVTDIGARAFAGCTALKAITVTENVGKIGANAFTGCTKLKVVRYLGDEPEAETGGTGNIYYHSNVSLVSGCLPDQRTWSNVGSWEAGEVQESGSTDSGAASTEGADSPASTNSVPTYTYNTVIWPEGGAGRPLLKWNNTSYKLKKVTLNYNDGGKTSPTSLIYVSGRVLGVLPESDSDGFVGWFTERYGGTEVDPYTVVNSPMTFYAHWSGEASGNGTRGLVDAFSAFYEDESDDDDTTFSYAAATFDGLLIDDETVAGTIQVKTKKGKYVVAADGSNSNFTATMQLLGSKKTTLSGVIGSDGKAEVEVASKELSLSIELSQFGLTGTYSTDGGEYAIIAARDRYSAGSDGAKATVRVAIGYAGKKWNAILPTESAEGDGSDAAAGYSVLSINIGSKGRATVRGTMADGTRVSVSSRLIVGDSCCCLPVVVPLYANSGGFSFAIWFTWSEDGSESQASIAGLSGWNASGSKSMPFEATFADALIAEAGASGALGEVAFQLDGFFSLDGADDSFTPDGTEIDASTSRWKLPKADSVRFVKDEGWATAEGKDYGNPAGLKLTYSEKTGLFKGSFKVFSETEEGRSKKYTATVTGAVVDGVGYGTATIKKVGSLPVKVE